MNRDILAFRRLLALVLTLVLVGACGGRDADDATGGTGTGDGGAAQQVSPGPGFDGTTIKLGVLTPLSGPVADPIGLPLTAGGDVYWQKVNAAGGVAGKYKVELVKEDNQYVNEKTKSSYTKIKNDVVLFSQILGTPPTQTVLQDLKTDGIVASPASLDAAWVREPNLLPVGSTYQLQFVNAASYLVEKEAMRDKTLCGFAIESDYGNAGMEGLRFAAEHSKEFKLGPIVSFKGAPNESYTAQITELNNAGCSAVFLTSLPTQTGQIIGAAAGGLHPRWVGQSPTWVSALAANAQLAPLLQKTFLWTSEGTTWGDESVAGMKDMIADVRQYKPDQQPDVYFVFGYAQARAVHQLLENAVENGDLSRRGMTTALEDLEVDFKGLLGDYKYGKATERDPSRETVVFKVNPAVPGALEKVQAVNSKAADAFTFK